MHQTAVVLIALAGLCYCLVAVRRWLLLRLAAGVAGRPWLVWIGMGLHSAGLALSLLDAERADFAHAVLGSWAALASLLFLSRFLASPNRWLLVLPVGGMVLLLAVAGLAVHPREATPGHMPAIIVVHILFMTAQLAAALLAGASAFVYLVAVRQLKAAQAGAFTLPNLPKLDHLFERSLVVSTALLIGGLATGGAAISVSPNFSLAHPASILSLVNMGLLVLAWSLRLANGLSRRGLAWGALASLAVAAIATVSLIVNRHG
jgi:hypothetical protein